MQRDVEQDLPLDEGGGTEGAEEDREPWDADPRRDQEDGRQAGELAPAADAVRGRRPLVASRRTTA
jgi:hypothetical protein